MAEKILTIKCSNAATYQVAVDCFTQTVLALKQKIEEKHAIPANQQRLIFRGKVLKDENSLEFYEITEGQTVHLVKGAPKPTDSVTPAAAAKPSDISNSLSNHANLFSTSFPNAPNRGGAGTFGLPFSGGMDMNSMSQQLMQNPEMMQQILNSPMMDSLLNNPDMMRDMMMNNPQMQGLLDSNPQIRHVLNDPSVLRQTMEMMRNPNAMREAMRSQDLAMSQIENHPEGFNALRRMYEDIQEPMMQAQAQAAAQADTNSWGVRTPAINSASSSSSAVPNSSALPNPWGRPASNPAAAAPFGSTGGFPGMLGMPGPMPGMNPGLGQGLGGLPPGMDVNQLNTMMQNPMMQQMMQQMMSDPAFLQQAAARDPHMAAVLSNPQTRAMLSDPTFMRQMMNPQNMQAMIQMQQAMQTLQRNGIMPAAPGLPGTYPSIPSVPSTGTGLYGQPPGTGGLDFSSLFGATPVTSVAPMVPPVDNTVRFANQIEQLHAMGFNDDTANIRALLATNGNVSAAVERLLGA